MPMIHELPGALHPSARRSLVKLGIGALLGLSLSGYALFTAKGTRSRGTPPEAVALVNQRPILRSDFMAQAQAQFGVPFSQTTHEQRVKVLGDMLNEELLVQRGLEIDLPSFDPDVRSALVAGVELEVSADTLAKQPTERELRDYFEKHKGRYSSEGVMQLRDLLVRSSKTPAPATDRVNAAQAAAALRRGMRIEAAMSAYGLADSGHFVTGGHVDTGNIFQFAVRAKLDDALYHATIALGDGDVSDPIEDADGLHIIVMIRHSLPVPQGFEDAASRVWTDYRSDAQARVRGATLDYLRTRADIVTAPDMIR